MELSACGKDNDNLMIQLVKLKTVFAAAFRINLKQTLEAILKAVIRLRNIMMPIDDEDSEDE